MTEIFKEVIGYEGQYQISNYGNVYSTPTDGKPNRMLKQEVNKKSHTSYRRVALPKDGIVKRFLVHRLVATAFIDNLYNKPHVNHIDNNGENNNESNLEWVTHSENMIHAEKQGRLFKAHSKAAKRAGEAATEKRNNRVQSLIGSTFNGWTILSDAGNQGIKQSSYVTCKCKCGIEKDVDLSSVVTGGSKSCKSCALIHAHSLKNIGTFIEQYSLDNELINSFESIVEANKYTKIKKPYISSAISGTRKTAGGYIWKRKVKDIV